MIPSRGPVAAFSLTVALRAISSVKSQDVVSVPLMNVALRGIAGEESAVSAKVPPAALRDIAF